MSEINLVTLLMKRERLCGDLIILWPDDEWGEEYCELPPGHEEERHENRNCSWLAGDLDSLVFKL